MDNIFNDLNAEETAPVVEKVVRKEDGRKSKVDSMKEALKETILTDPEFDKKLGRLSDSIKVINTLGFGDGGNIVVDKSKPVEIDPETGKEKKPLLTTSKTIGYRVQNIGDEPIKYQTEVWTKGEDGKYVSTKTEKVLEPGETADLSRQYMTVLCSIPEISFQLANGKIIKGSSKRAEESTKAFLEAHYFRFDKDEDGVQKQVNDDDVKLNVGERDEATGKWVVKPEFEETFGYLNNPIKSTSSKKAAGRKYSAQDLAANYVRKMIEKQGL